MGLLDSIPGGDNDTSDAQSSLLGNKEVLLVVSVLAYLTMEYKSQGTSDAAMSQGRENQDSGLFGSPDGLLNVADGAGALSDLFGGVGGAGGFGGLPDGLLGDGNGSVDQVAIGGLGPLQQILEQVGLGEQVRSWIGSGQNLPVPGKQVTQAPSGTGALKKVPKLAANFGTNKSDLANRLAEGLPEAVSHLVPQDTVPAV